MKTGSNGYFFSGGNQGSMNKLLHIGFNVIANKYFFGFWANDCASVSEYANDFNNWIYLTFIYNNNTKERSIYRNGVKIAISNAISTSGDLTVNNDMNIGRRTYGDGYINGYVDDLRIYTGKVLDQEEITRIYNGTKTDYTTQITEPIIGMDLSPVIWYKFDDSTILVWIRWEKQI
jgi:hypothetical protein